MAYLKIFWEELMKKHILLKTNIILCLIIFAGFLGITSTSYNTYKKVLEDDVENISKLTSSTLYSKIDGKLIEPLFVAQTMANDTFLKSWLKHEKENINNNEYKEVVEEYLYAIKEKYGYDSAFLISAGTNIYYFYDGINKIVNEENEHDIWYYNFINKNKSYMLNIDYDEVNNETLTIFVDCRVENKEGKLLGVVGVGIKMDHLQKLLKSYEDEFDLNAFLTDKNGLIKVDTDSENIEMVNLFEDEKLSKVKCDIFTEHSNAKIHWYGKNKMCSCLIVQYIPNLEWYLVVEKNTQVIRDSFHSLLKKDIAISSLILVLLMALSSYIIKRYNHKLFVLSKMDELTGLPNSDALEMRFLLEENKWAEKGTILFLLDVDDFKIINDTKGHIFGNTILTNIGEIVGKMTKSYGMSVRWGGDEFVGTISLPLEESRVLIEEIMEEVYKTCLKDGWKVTLSIGITDIKKNSKLNDLIEEADRAMYFSKCSGKNKITYYEDIK